LYSFLSILPSPSCLKKSEPLVLAHEKKSEVQQGEYFPDDQVRIVELSGSRIHLDTRSRREEMESQK
jgi:hypothetical protein